MKTLVLFVVAVVACGNKPTTETAAGSGSSLAAAGAVQAGAGSAIVGSGAATGSGAVTHPRIASGSGGAARSAAALALEDFDRVFAPIWKLGEGAHIRAKCAHTKLLEQRASAIPGELPGPHAEDWTSARGQLTGLVGELGLRCGEIPKKAFASDAELAKMDGYFPDSGNMLRDAYSRLVAVVPDASPVDAHAADPVPPADRAGSPAVPIKRLREALQALNAQLGRLSAKAARASGRSAACADVVTLKPLVEALAAPDLLAGPPGVDGWSDRVRQLDALVGDLDVALCGTDSIATVEQVQERYGDVQDQGNQLLKACCRRNLPSLARSVARF